MKKQTHSYLTFISMLSFIILMLSPFTVVGYSQETALDEPLDQQIVRVSHGQPTDHPDHLAMLKFAEYIEEHLGDKYIVQIYDNSLLGDSKNALELTQTGAIDYIICSTSNLEAYNNAYGLFSLPYLFLNEAAYFEFMNSELSEQLYSSTEESGLQAVTWFNAGSRNFYGSKPYANPEDLKGEKIRVQPSPLNVQMMEALGAGAVPMSFGEVYTAIQQGTIDGAENNELALTTVKHGEVSSYFTYDEHQRQPDMLVASVRFLDSLDEADRRIFDEATQLAHEVELEEWDKATEAAIEEAKAMGVEFVEANIPAFMELVQSVHESYLQDEPDAKQYYDLIMTFNEESREGEE